MSNGQRFRYINKELKRCPFCGGKVAEAEGIGGLLFFSCMNFKDCGAIISFDQALANKHPDIARKMFNRREGGTD